VHIGFLVFDGLTNLDLAGPYEVLARLPEASTFLVAKTVLPVRSDVGLMLTPDTTFENASAADVLVVPGGPGVNRLLDDQETLSYIKHASHEAKYITSVCTGALVLGAAGLLKGRKATTHWMAREFLASFGATPVVDRVVVDGPIITGGGVTAGIDFALELAMRIAGRATAEQIQLSLEYNPQPPLDAGSPERAGEDIVMAVRSYSSEMVHERACAVAKATARLFA
jgi:cyclohexyl-isocyanide hydratase